MLYGRNICSLIGHEIEKIINAAYCYKLLPYESDFFFYDIMIFMTLNIVFSSNEKRSAVGIHMNIFNNHVHQS